MKKITKITLILISIGIILLIGFLILGTLVIQDRYKEPIEQRTEITENHQTETKTNKNLVEFLENPIDLIAFKKKKRNGVTTSVTNGTEYYFNPNGKNATFYVYYYPKDEIIPKEIDQIVVLKYGQNKHSYEDETEAMIELRVFSKDSDLGKANLVGLTITELETEFGTDYLTLDNKIIYSNKNKVLIIELFDSKIKSFSYIRLNTEKIDSSLIEQITK